MKLKKQIFAIVGSASKNSANLKLVYQIAQRTITDFDLVVFDELNELPHFNPEQSIENTPSKVIEFRRAIEEADGILICTPEYIFSIPSGLKNALEWCVSTTVFSDKPFGLITASASGLKGHEELKLIMRTIQSVFTEETTLLIQGIKGKIDQFGNVTDVNTEDGLVKFIEAFKALIENSK